jgi:DNA-binding helix-hairpin-helix protein with protein kinase domain
VQLFSTRDRRALSLGAEIARGGEGAIFSISGDQNHVVKKYLKAPTSEKLEKLHVMSGASEKALANIAAWPMDLLVPRAGDPPSKAIAFVMPKVSASGQLHELYTPKSRSYNFPDADLRFIIHVAANVVRAFGVVHQSGHVIGDVNHGHILLSANGRVHLIDCDSFQIAANDQLFTCDVGTPLFTAPELQGQGFRGLARTADHDRFGLAVLLFHLLFMGRHPYSGVPLDPRQSAEIEPAIRAGRFAYGAGRKQLGVDQPPGTIPLDTYGASIAALFERSFGQPSDDARPTEKEWLDALLALQDSLKLCAVSASHHYPGHLAACPWCSIEGRTGVRLFGLKIQGQPSTGPTDLGILWRAIEAAPRPKKVGDVETKSLVIPERTKTERLTIAVRQIRKIAVVGGFVAMILMLVMEKTPPIGVITLSFFLSPLIWPRADNPRRTKAKLKLRIAKDNYDNVVAEWRRSATDAKFLEVQSELEKAKFDLSNMAAERARRIEELTSEGKQKEVFLDKFRIDQGKIPGVGQGRASVLASFGIETAWDVSQQKIRSVPGFGPTLISNLMTWRADHLARFQYNPHLKASPAEILAIDADLLARKNALIARLRAGPYDLRRANEEAERARLRLRPLVEQRYVQLQIAKRAVADS